MGVWCLLNFRFQPLNFRFQPASNFWNNIFGILLNCLMLLCHYSPSHLGGWRVTLNAVVIFRRLRAVFFGRRISTLYTQQNDKNTKIVIKLLLKLCGDVSHVSTIQVFVEPSIVFDWANYIPPSMSGRFPTGSRGVAHWLGTYATTGSTLYESHGVKARLAYSLGRFLFFFRKLRIKIEFHQPILSVFVLIHFFLHSFFCRFLPYIYTPCPPLLSGLITSRSLAVIVTETIIRFVLTRINLMR